MLDAKTIEKVQVMGAPMGKLERVRCNVAELKKAEEAQKHLAELEGG